MRTELWIGLGIVVSITLVVMGLGAGWLLMGRHVWTSGMMGGYNPGVTGGCNNGVSPSGGVPDTCDVVSPSSPTTSVPLSIQQALVATEAYVSNLEYNNLEIAEVMEFEHNYYAIVREQDTGIGAMEVLVDKKTGAVGPERGPNMMWNTRYGIHGRGGMMGRGSGTNVLSTDDARVIAQRWLDANRPGVTVEEHVDPFYGYYTIHTLKDERIEGMLGVHGTAGQVWYHTWHGQFIRVLDRGEGEDHRAQ